MLLAGILGLGLVACSSAAATLPERDADRRPSGHRAVDRTLVAGTLVEATIHNSHPTRRTEPGETLMATVSADVRNAHGWVVIPAGCVVGLKIERRRPGTGLLDLTSMTVRGQAYPVNATVELPPAAGTRVLFVLSEGFTAQRRLGEMP